MTEFLYTRSGDFFVPTDVGGSPWHPSLLHGGTATGLLGHAVQSQLPPGFVVTRQTMDLVRPVPKAPLAVRSEIARDGARLKVIGIEVTHDGKTVCRASAVAMKTQHVTLPDYAPLPHPPPPGPDGLPPFSIQQMLDAKGLKIPRGLHTRVEVRGRELWQERGHNMSWMRLPVTILENEPLTPFVRACLLSDLGNGVAQLNLGNATGMINADVTLALYRLPVGEWLGFDAEAQVQATGTGIVHSTLYDRDGSFGFVVQSVMTNREFSG
ncbi:MAG: thioesterase family protein [Pseudomonadota bacterium]